MLLSLALLAAAAPAAAQVPTDPYWMARDAELRTQQELERQRSIALHNEITTMETRLQTEQSLEALQAQARRPAVVMPSEGAGGAAAVGAAPNLGGFVDFPADRIAASNARVRAASRPAR